MPNEASDKPLAGDAQVQSSTEMSGAPPLHQSVDAAGHDQLNDSTKELADEIHWVHRATFWLQLGLGVIGIVALCIYYGQLRTMNLTYGEMVRQYPELQKSADAAKKSAETAENSFQVERRRAEDMEEAVCTLKGGGASRLRQLLSGLCR